MCAVRTIGGSPSPCRGRWRPMRWATGTRGTGGAPETQQKSVRCESSSNLQSELALTRAPPAAFSTGSVDRHCCHSADVRIGTGQEHLA